MRIKEIKNEPLNEKYFHIDHPSGLTVLLFPKEDYATNYAVFAAKYGSIDNKLVSPDGTVETIPEGTAHFLEHKLFESEELDAFERFAKTGASANAYTSFDRTGYLFSCTGNFRESLEILLDFVQNPYFTQKTVEKEQGIIGQEIKMYKDVPEWEVLFNLLGAMYKENPVRTDIAGTVDSISKITADLLYRCYNTFYDLSNMVLAVAGNVCVEEVLEVADKMLKPAKGKPAQRVFVPESSEVVTPYVEESLTVAIPSFLLGFKEAIKTPERTTTERLSAYILLDIIAGPESPLYKRLIEAELVNTGFSYEYFEGFGYSCSIFGGLSKNPKKAAEEIKKEIQSFARKGVSSAEFERSRRKLYGGLIMMYNDVSAIANSLAETFFNANGLFDDLEACKVIDLDMVNARFKDLFSEDNSVLSVIWPL